MAYIKYNPNPTMRNVGDCAVRAISKALKMDWESAFATLAMYAYQMGDMPSSDAVWGAVLSNNGFTRKSIPNTCPNCYTAKDFCKDNPLGTYVLGFGGHVATVQNGDLFDAWNSSNEVPQFYWEEE